MEMFSRRIQVNVKNSFLEKSIISDYLSLSAAMPWLRVSYIRQTSSSTRSTPIRCMQTLSLQGEVRPFRALTHGLQAMPAQNT